MSDPLYQVDESHYVLCPELYRRLRENFQGGVIIANQGEGFLSSSPRQSDGRYYTTVHHSGEYYRANCPFCKDTRHRLWVNHMYGQLDANGRPMRFLANCYNENCLANYENWRRFNDAIFGFRNDNERHVPQFALNAAEWMDPADGLREVDTPGQLMPVSQMARSMPNHPAVQYLCYTRQYTTYMLDHYEVSYCMKAHPKYREAQDRIIFPIRMENRLVGWQARYLGTADWRAVPKYYGMPGMRKRFMLYNYDNAKGRPFVIVTEGPTDCHKVGDYSVSLLGKSMSRYQMDLLLAEWGNKPIVLVLDPDARESMMGTLQSLQNHAAVVVNVYLPEGYDCGDYDRQSIWNIIDAQTRHRGVILQT